MIAQTITFYHEKITSIINYIIEYKYKNKLPLIGKRTKLPKSLIIEIAMRYTYTNTLYIQS